MLAEILAMSEYIPRGARHTYQAMCCDYRLRLFAAVDDRPRLMLEMAGNADALIRAPISAVIPPPLWRRPGETPDQYLDRCYQSAQGRWTSAHVTAEDTAPFNTTRRRTVANG